MSWLSFFAGAFVGAIVAMFLMSAVFLARRSDDQSDAAFEEMESRRGEP